MADIRTKIDELIEESYLATLPEDAIRQDLLQFLDTCDRLVEEAVEGGKGEDLLQRLEGYKALALRIDQAAEQSEEQEEWGALSPHDLLAHRAARVKLLVLDTIRGTDAGLAERIEHRRFPKGKLPREGRMPGIVVQVAPSRRTLFTPATTVVIVRASYAILAGVTLFIIGYRLFH